MARSSKEFFLHFEAGGATYGPSPIGSTFAETVRSAGKVLAFRPGGVLGYEDKGQRQPAKVEVSVVVAPPKALEAPPQAKPDVKAPARPLKISRKARMIAEAVVGAGIAVVSTVVYFNQHPERFPQGGAYHEVPLDVRVSRQLYDHERCVGVFTATIHFPKKGQKHYLVMTPYRIEEGEIVDGQSQYYDGSGLPVASRFQTWCDDTGLWDGIKVGADTDGATSQHPGLAPLPDSSVDSGGQS